MLHLGLKYPASTGFESEVFVSLILVCSTGNFSLSGEMYGLSNKLSPTVPSLDLSPVTWSTFWLQRRETLTQ